MGQKEVDRLFKRLLDQGYGVDDARIRMLTMQYPQKQVDNAAKCAESECSRIESTPFEVNYFPYIAGFIIIGLAASYYYVPDYRRITISASYLMFLILGRGLILKYGLDLMTTKQDNPHAHTFALAALISTPIHLATEAMIAQASTLMLFPIVTILLPAVSFGLFLTLFMGVNWMRAFTVAMFVGFFDLIAYTTVFAYVLEVSSALV